MSDRLDDKLEKLLRSRRIEAASPDLARRIALGASELRQNRTPSLWRWVAALFDEFHLPRPAYVLAGALILGVVVGLNSPVETGSPEELAPVNVQSFLYAKGN